MAAINSVALEDEMLVAALHVLGVEHLARLQPLPVDDPGVNPVQLLRSLAAHRQARFRNALILLFLRRPSWSRFVPSALAELPVPAADTLRLFYQAAAYLRLEIDAELRRFSDDLAPLPDLFSSELQLPAPGTVPSAVALQVLGRRHAERSGKAYNWAGSYRQHLALFLRQLKRGTHAGPITARPDP